MVLSPVVVVPDVPVVAAVYEPVGTVACVPLEAVQLVAAAFVVPVFGTPAFGASYLPAASVGRDSCRLTSRALCLVLPVTLQIGWQHLPFLNPHCRPLSRSLRGDRHQLLCWPSASAVLRLS